MKKSIKIKCPAKINLTLDVINKRADGFHEINSVMQLINLYDYLTINIEHATQTQIILNGNSKEIPYDSKNLVYKAVALYLKKYNIENFKIEIYIEKNIPIAAGLAGGSTDAAGTLYGLDYLFKKSNDKVLNEMCADLGSDLNVCLQGGCIFAQSRGEEITKLPVLDYEISLIKPKKLGISAKEAYTKFDLKNIIKNKNYTEEIIKKINNNEDIKKYFHNDLEIAIYSDYKELQEIKNKIPNAIMSGSGPTFFIPDNLKKSPLNEDFEFINNLKFIKTGVEIVELE